MSIKMIVAHPLLVSMVPLLRILVRIISSLLILRSTALMHVAGLLSTLLTERLLIVSLMGRIAGLITGRLRTVTAGPRSRLLIRLGLRKILIATITRISTAASTSGVRIVVSAALIASLVSCKRKTKISLIFHIYQ